MKFFSAIVKKIICVSTAHLSRADIDLLNSEDEIGIPYESVQCGWLVSVSPRIDLTESLLSDTVKKIYAAALADGIDLIRFDSDGTVVSAFDVQR
jgi:hypothetical protein